MTAVVIVVNLEINGCKLSTIFEADLLTSLTLESFSVTAKQKAVQFSILIILPSFMTFIINYILNNKI